MINLVLMRVLRNRSRSLSLKRKIMLFVALLLFIAIFAVGFYSYSIAVNQAVDRIFQSQQGLVGQVADNLSQLLGDAEDISSLIVIDPNLQVALSRPDWQKSAVYPGAFEYLDKIMAVKSFIAMIAIYGDNGLTYSAGTDFIGNSVVTFEEFKQHPLFAKALALNGGIGMEYFSNEPRVTYDNRLPRLVMYRLIKELHNYRNVGVLLIWLNEQKIRSIYNANVPPGGSLFIVNEQGTIISASEPARINQPFFKGNFAGELLDNSSRSKTIKYNGKTMLLTLSASKLNGWKVIALTPAVIVTEKINSIAVIIIMVSMVCYLLMLFFSNFITAKITQPLQQLLASFKKVQAGDLSQQVHFTGDDEIGELGRGYNAMLARIDDLIERVYKLQIKEREAELKALQAQINPHFLYNTLDIIFWKANKSRDPEISQMVYALSKIFRLSLNRGREMTTVALEQELIQYYLVLQQIRFREKLSYQIDFDPCMWAMTIPKLILQPFVENAIIHGIEKQESGGRIDVAGRFQDKWLVFTIRDNGVGMSDEQITRNISRLENESSNPSIVAESYAIHNVLARLELYYSSNYALQFDSQPGVGTTVTIKIPRHLPVDTGR